MTSQELNEAIEAICGEAEYSVGVFPRETGKAVPYIGWFWRSVDFDRPISFGDCGVFVGFMENNKWGYPEYDLTPEQDAECKRRLRELVAAPSREACKKFWEWAQTTRPNALQPW
jgi:hypothetical protein